jgi:hypothetical protein
MTQPILALLAAGAMATAPNPPMPSAAEAQFIAGVSKSLAAEYPTVAAAEAHGFMQMTKLESDGTMIFATMKYAGMDADHPNFLWYDRHGKLVGLDYEYPVSSWPKPPGPSVYPVAASRWVTIHQHVHFAYRIGSGPTVLRGAKAQPNLMNGPITAAELTADGLLPKGAMLEWAEFHPTCWDLGFWTVPNPNGAFADLDPLVK